MTRIILAAAALFLCAGSALAQVSEDRPLCAVISTMDTAADWDGPVPPKVVTEPGGRTCLEFNLGKGGSREWTLKTFPESGIRMADYDALKFDYRVEGGSFSLSTNVRQWPWYGGFLCLFYQIDEAPGQPHQWTTDVSLAPENAWAPTFSRGQSCFQLAIGGTADPGKELRLYLDNIRLVRYPFTVDCVPDIFLALGERTDAKDGSLQYRYPLTLRNRTGHALAVALDLDRTRLRHFVPTVENTRIEIPAGGTATAGITLALPNSARAGLPPVYCELAVARFSLPGQPETEIAVNLLPAVPHAIPHPSLFATVNQIAEAKKRCAKWGWAKQAADWYLKRAEFALALPHSLPDYQLRAEQPGDRVCAKCAGNTRLRTIDDAESVFRYQCENCGAMLSPKTGFEHSESGYWWKPDSKEPAAHAISFNRAGNILDLAVAWHLTGEDKYLQKIGLALREYLRVLPTYPSRSTGIAFEKFNAKGGYRLGDYFSQCGWLNRMTDVLDLTWDTGILTPEERAKLVAELKAMALTRLRLAMALQHRPNEATLAIALLSNDASLLAYLYDNPLNGGARQALEAFILPDGMPDMAAQYIEPPMMSWLDIIQTYRNAGLPLDDEVPGLRKFGTALRLWLDPDGRSPSLGDAGPMGLPGWFVERCYAWYGNPADIEPVQQTLFQAWQESKPRTPWESLPRQGGSPVTAAGAALFYGAENIPRGAPARVRPSHNYPEAGLLVFNQGEGDRQLWAAVPYGKQLGHGHHDNLHLEWWALGQKISVKQGHRGRQHPVHENTLIVDGRDQMKVPCQVSEFVDDGLVQGAVITSPDLYPGTTVCRTIMLYDGLIFLFDRFAAETDHDFDMVYANAGTAHCDLGFQPRKDPLSRETDANGLPANYALFEEVATVVPAQPVHILWDNLKQPGIQVRFTQFAVGSPGELLRVRAPLVTADWERITGDVQAAGYTDEAASHRFMGSGKDRISYMGTKFIRRVRGRNAGLLTILEPFRGETPRLNGFALVPFTLDGKPTDQGVALEYSAENGITHRVLLCPVAGTKNVGGAQTRAFFTAGFAGFLR